MKTTWLMLVVSALATPPAFAQHDISGEWGVRHHEDFWHRRAGPDVGDYLGLPINDAARVKAESWQEAVLAEPERQCIPHVATYAMRHGGGNQGLRIAKVLDPVTGDVIGYTVAGNYGRADRTIWLDGRPHPPEHAKHTWAGFSTGVWEGNKLKVTTTHIKMGWFQRNGVPSSDKAIMTEYFIRQDNNLTVVGIVDDPIYLDEPLIRSTNWELAVDLNIPGGFDCGPDQIATEAEGFEKHHVPHFLPGANEYLREFSRERDIPFEASRGGAATMYPEYMLTLKKLSEASAAALRARAARSVGATDPFLGRWVLHRGKSTFTGGSLPARRITRFEAAPDGVRHITDTQPMGNDSGFDRVEYVTKFDGSDSPVKGSTLATAALRRVDAKTIERTAKQREQVIETSRWSVSDDGKILTVTTQGADGDRTYSSVQVFERQ